MSEAIEPVAPLILQINDLHVAYGARTVVDGLTFHVRGERSSVYLDPTARARPAR
ncbi:hypothetical protein OS914_08735 [Arthrobacter sp. H14-L1]|nr:hypothetical protein [Arthrobacter sp. H14-L1]MCY0904986.1 hypothetical protein [Arthrobacter sp. H14-L1]